ncbi:hypothetical protein, partial [Prevotella bivia]
ARSSLTSTYTLFPTRAYARERIGYKGFHKDSLCGFFRVFCAVFLSKIRKNNCTFLLSFFDINEM